MMPSDAKPPFFVVGCPRSGTTLLTDLLRSHPHIAVPRESHFIPSFYVGYGDPKDSAAAMALGARILSLPRVRTYGVKIPPSEFAPDRTFAAIVYRIYSAYAAQNGRQRWGDKTPHYVEWIPVLRRIFPDAPIIHIVRDGRDVAASWIKAGIEPANLYTAAELWNRMVRRGRADGAALDPDSYLEIRYEALLDDTRAVMECVCAFIGEPMCDAVLRPTRARDIRRKVHVGQAREILKQRDTVDASNHGKWRTAMPVRDRVMVESVAGDLLAELGYETEGIGRNISSLERAAWRLHHAVGWPLARLNDANAKQMVSGYLKMHWARLRGGGRAAS